MQMSLAKREVDQENVNANSASNIAAEADNNLVVDDVDQDSQDSMASMRKLCDSAIRELPEEDKSNSEPPFGYPRDFYTDKYRVEEAGNGYRIVT